MANLAFAVHDQIIAQLSQPGVTLGLLTTSPNGDGTNVMEPSNSAGYQRQPLTLGATTRAQPKSIVTNSAPLIYGPASATWPAVLYFGVFSAAGQLLCYGPTPTSRLVPAGDSVSFGVGAVQIRLN